ncbi:hypothetical protein GJ744_005530 [Endocarpon pusillum]|uniref:Uncharacterized protein n=1 Tax=Endocarpon pusillum TaxID=364733 RepID=A0A8H7E593_9EURO|nr:hypothetical protein GJ744_005530 [Endocarpon pusillum]
MTRKDFREREFMKAQLLSLGNDIDVDTPDGRWTNNDIQQLIEILIEEQDRNFKEAPGRRRGGVRVKRKTPHVRIEKHIRDVNDSMTGALPPRRDSKSEDEPAFDLTREDIDDATVCLDTLPRLYRSMPHYMVSVKVLKTMGLFNDPVIYEMLPRDFMTTIKGLKRAWDEANAAQPDEEEDLDVYLLDAMLKRGGLVRDAEWRVVYPSDIKPLNGEDGDPDFWKELRGLAWEFEE